MKQIKEEKQNLQEAEFVIKNLSLSVTMFVQLEIARLIIKNQ